LILERATPILALLLSGGCTTWTSVRAGYALPLSSDRPVVGVEASHGIGASINTPAEYASILVDGSEDTQDAAARVGVMAPLTLSGDFTLAPFAQAELLRLSHIDGNWYGGAFGPGAGAEIVWWSRTHAVTSDQGPKFGCFGGATGVDCPRCRVTDVTRYGVSARASVEYDVRYGSGPDDSILWIMLGFTRAESEGERSCCYYDYHSPTRADCLKKE